jgi:hypothetical protein
MLRLEMLDNQIALNEISAGTSQPDYGKWRGCGKFRGRDAMGKTACKLFWRRSAYA